MTDSKKRNTGPRRHLEHKARGVTCSSSPPSRPSPPTLESPSRRLPGWAWWVAITLTVGPITVSGNNCIVQCNHQSAPIYASR